MYNYSFGDATPATCCCLWAAALARWPEATPTRSS